MKKIDLPKEKLRELYSIKKLTMHEIAEIYQVDRTTISTKLKEFQIEINPTHRKYLHLKAVPITKQQKEMLIGSLLGDGSIIKRGKTSSFKVSHCEKQKEYLLWKKEILGNFVNHVMKYEDKRGNSIMYSINTLSHHELNYFHKLFYENNKKVIRNELIHHLTDLGLAVWFMDDGSRQKYSSRLSTDGFTKEENNILQNILKVNFGLNVKVCEYTRNTKKYYYLLFNKRNTIILNEIIKPYVVDCLKYKMIDCSSTTTR